MRWDPRVAEVFLDGVQVSFVCGTYTYTFLCSLKEQYGSTPDTHVSIQGAVRFHFNTYPYKQPCRSPPILIHANSTADPLQNRYGSYSCVYHICMKMYAGCQEACEEQLVQEPFQQQIVQGLPEQQMIVTTPMSAKEFL